MAGILGCGGGLQQTSLTTGVLIGDEVSKSHRGQRAIGGIRGNLVYAAIHHAGLNKNNAYGP